MSQPTIREFRFPQDYPAVRILWESAGPGVHVGPSDTPEEILKKLGRDPDLFLVAEVAGAIVGTVLGGFDGRRGLVYHLAVASNQRRRGIATQLMNEVELRLRRKGCRKCYLLVRPDNVEAVAYYDATGWSASDNLLYMKEFE